MAHFTLNQRYEIQTYRKEGKGFSEIGRLIGRDKSVVSREVGRNSDQRNNVYSAKLADRKALSRHAEKPKYCRLNASVENNIIHYLSLDYSPEQMVGRSKLEGKEMVSVESIYKYIWKDKRKGGILYRSLRANGKKYRKRGRSKESRGIITGRVDIDERPAVVDRKERIGDLEIDLVIGKDHKGALITINDRSTGVLFMDKIENKEAGTIEAKAIELLQDWKPLLKTITSDNGKEFANHSEVADSLNIDFYFAKPYHSWQRGANENLNGLVRQYFPKKSDFGLITKERIKQVNNILNNRPRKRFGYKTPNEIFAQKLDELANVAFIT
jgi:IS30 family transposase